MRSFATVLLTLSLPLHAFASHAINHARRHDVALYTRGTTISNARMSFYDIDVGLTACGGRYPASAFVVAMNAAQFGDVPGQSTWCGKTITISYNGKSTQAMAVDKCPGCPYGGLDLTRGLFSFFAPLGAGIIYGSWVEGGGAPAEEPTTSSKPPPPSPTSHYTPPTTSSPAKTSSPPPPSSTSTSTTSKTSSSISSASSTSSVQPSSSKPSPTQTSSSSLAVPSPVSKEQEQDQTTDQLLQAVLGLGNLVAASNP